MINSFNKLLSVSAIALSFASSSAMASTMTAAQCQQLSYGIQSQQTYVARNPKAANVASTRAEIASKIQRFEANCRSR